MFDLCASVFCSVSCMSWEPKNVSFKFKEVQLLKHLSKEHVILLLLFH